MRKGFNKRELNEYNKLKFGMK